MSYLGISRTSGGAGGFKFDWTAAREESLRELTPYYEQKLKEAGGDVERAKKLMEEDYKIGVRYTTEDYGTGERFRTEDLASQLKEFGIESTEETRTAREALNQRGVLFQETPREQVGVSETPYSEYAKEVFLTPLEERQNLRKQAIERAIKRQSEIALTDKQRKEEQLKLTKERGIQEQDIQYPRTQRDLEEEKRRRALTEVTPLKYQEARAKFEATLPT